jgi:hypothetical protein
VAPRKTSLPRCSATRTIGTEGGAVGRMIGQVHIAKSFENSRTSSAQISTILESGSGAFQMSERRSALGKIGVERLLKSARIILNRAIATRVFPNSPSDSFEHDWPNRSSGVQSRLIARMHIDARIDELFGTERTHRSRVSVKIHRWPARGKYERDLAW